MLAKLPPTLSLLGILLGVLLPIFISPTLGHISAAHERSRNSHNPLCVPISFTLTATASHISLASPPDPSNETEILDIVNQSWDGTLVGNGTHTVNGTFTLKAIYCRPFHESKNEGVLQILLHGATYNKTMWSGYGFGYPYDWQSYATSPSQGCHTLALDRLSHGENDPRGLDPLTDVQMPLQTELLHQLISVIKTQPNTKTTFSKTNPLGKTFSKIALVGHSLGSYLAVALARSYPLDASALVLTGYSSRQNTLHVRSAPWAPAPSVFPDRFPSNKYLHNLEYLTIATLEGREKGFYDNATDAAGRSHDPALAKTDYEHSDAVTLGEVVSLGDWGVGAEGFEGAVLVATGQRDFVMLGEDGVRRLWETGKTFPRARTYEVWSPRGTGHDLTLSYSAGQTLQRIHEFLRREV